MRKSLLQKGKDTKVEQFFGVGEKRAEAFHKMGIFTARDAVYHFPRAYEPRGMIRSTAQAEDEEVCALMLTIATEPKNMMIRKGMMLTKFSAFDADGTCNIVFFNQPYVKDLAHKGMTFRFFGKVKREGLTLSMSSPVMEHAGGTVPLRDFVPIYPLTSGVTQKLMGSVIRESLAAVRSQSDGIREYLPEDMRARLGVTGVKEALRMIHMPLGMEETEIAIRRLAFDELYLFALSMMLYGKGEKTEASAYKICERAAFLSSLSYALTGAQTRTVEAIENDMKSGFLMNRLVVGDVGSGKTVCAAYAVYMTLINGKQAALMAPTEILARQHYGELSVFFGAMGYRTGLLVGSMTAAAKRKVIASLADGTIDFVIGTHALIEDAVVFTDLGLAVIDEQHRFGAGQRSLLAKKGSETHILTMSATPIPRTLAMVLYCETDVSVIDEMPPGRQKVDTFLVNEGYRQRLNAFIRKNIDAGGQVYIVCPAVEEEEKLETESGESLMESELLLLGMRTEEEKPKKKAAVAFAKLLSEQVFPEYRCAFVHGKLNGKEKDRIMNEFAAGNIDILVSTTVIEVGVNVPKATLMIVENADTFGLSALHQLRGRVGRGTRKSYCVLVSDSRSQKAKERLKILCETNDGFRIAEKDLEMRGPGDFLEQTYGKTRQSGEFDLGIASLERDVKLLYTAFDEAKRTLAEDPTLSLEKNKELASVLRDQLRKNQFGIT